MSSKYLFFTGENCSPCKALKRRIAELGLEDRFDMLDVCVHTEEVMKYYVRSLPHIVSPDGSHYVGSTDGLEFIESLSNG